MENTGDERQESFVSSLDQFFTSIEPVLKEANSIEAAEDLLTNLETTDDNFHRYEFVRKLRGRIDEVLGPLIDMKLESLSGEDSNSPLSRIADEIQTSQEFISLQQSVLADTKEAVNVLVQKYVNPLQRRTSDFDFSELKMSKIQTVKDSLDLSDEESLSSSIGQVGYMFMSQEKSGKIAENLHPLQPVQVKCEALSALAQVPQSDIITSEHWLAIRKGLLAALADDDNHLSEKSLKFHARMFLCSTSHSTREIYTCLAEHLWHCFNGNKNDMIGKIENGINVQTKNNARLIRRFRLLNEFQHEVPSYWTRYSERFLEEILEGTFTLIDTSGFQSSESCTGQLITPLHYLSLLDPIANWFRKWMHGNYSRTEVVKQLKEHPKLLSDAITAILDFPHVLKTAVTIPEILEDQEQQEREDSGSEEGLFYSARDLEYLFFVHSISLVGRLFLYSDGRALFPVELPERQETLTVTDLLVVFIKIMCIPMPRSMDKAGMDGTIVPGDLVSDVLQEIASNSEAIKECLCKDAITSSLLAPVQNILDGLPDLDSNEESDTESVLLLISDVLAALAASESGRLQLMYGESQERWQRSRFSPAHIIAGFAKKALADSLYCPLSNDVIAGFLFICRQLWTTSEGLIVLNQYALHEKVAQAWTKASEMQSMSTTSMDEQDDSVELDIQNTDSLVWESSLLDNLLNFAGTPKGVLLLQLTGMMDHSVGYLYKRYTKKLQVSKCEKFGYGVMVCQFAATAPGIVALKKKGYLQRLVQDVWTVFEGLHNRRMQPTIKHIDTIDSRSYNKALTNLLSVLSAFPAVYEVLTIDSRPSTSASEVEEIKPVEHCFDLPSSLAELIDRMIMIDSDSKISSLLNYEESHHFGLRVLNILCSCLDTLLFLESKYRFTELLLQAQLDNILDNGKDYIIDRCSIERNQILVKSYWIGGPSERILPGRTLTEDPNDPYPWPLFSSFPPPKDYVVKDHPVMTNAFEEDDNILEFLERETPVGAESIEWLEKFRELFCTTIRNGGFKCKTKVLKLLLECVCHALTNIPEESIFPLIEFSVGELSLKTTELSSIESLGVKLVIRYGLQLKIFQSSRDATDDLQHLLKYAKFFMRSQQKIPDSTLQTLSVEYPGHDWFVSTIFLMFGGDPDESREFLFKFSSLVCSGYLWIRRLHASVHLPTSLTVSGIPPLYSCTCHNVELILQAEVPLVFSALRMSGYTPSQICQHWLRQCFWNYLPWDMICLYVCVCLTLGIDYQVYFCIAIFKHLQQEILKSTQEQRLLVMLKEGPIRDFRLEDHLDFMIGLERRYRPTILSDLQNITRP